MVSTPIRFKVNCNFNDKRYSAGDILNITPKNIDRVWKLNEKGFIEPITKEQFLNLKKGLETQNKTKKTRKKGGLTNG